MIDYSFGNQDVMMLYVCLRHGLNRKSNATEPAVTKINELHAANLEEL
jgi:hypothetical protein